jgi:hypothetical protein
MYDFFQDHPICVSLSNIDDEKWQKNKDDAVPERDNQNAGNRPSNGKGSITKTNDNDHNFHGRKDVIDDDTGCIAVVKKRGLQIYSKMA